jgi:hypothetical protein
MMCQFFSTSAGLIDRVCLLSAFMAVVSLVLSGLSGSDAGKNRPRINRPDGQVAAQMSFGGVKVKQKRRFAMR